MVASFAVSINTVGPYEWFETANANRTSLTFITTLFFSGAPSANVFSNIFSNIVHTAFSSTNANQLFCSRVPVLSSLKLEILRPHME